MQNGFYGYTTPYANAYTNPYARPQSPPPQYYLPNPRPYYYQPPAYYPPIYQPPASAELETIDAIKLLQAADSNDDGVVSKEELSHLGDILAKTTPLLDLMAKFSGTYQAFAGIRRKLETLGKLHAFLTAHFNTIASAADTDAESISVLDVLKTAHQDGHIMTLSEADIDKLNPPPPPPPLALDVMETVLDEIDIRAHVVNTGINPDNGDRFYNQDPRVSQGQLKYFAAALKAKGTLSDTDQAKLDAATFMDTHYAKLSAVQSGPAEAHRADRLSLSELKIAANRDGDGTTVSTGDLVVSDVVKDRVAAFLVLHADALNRFGDRKDRAYPGGTPLFDEGGLSSIALEDYVLRNFPSLGDASIQLSDIPLPPAFTVSSSV